MTENNASINNYNNIKELLANINWNFYQPLSFILDQLVPFDTRKHLPYPGTYVPEIPFTLIELLTKPGAIVLDPFSGSGTTFFQALILDRQPFATDICQVSIEYINSLFKVFNHSLNRKESIDNLKKIIFKYDPSVNYSELIKDEYEYLDKMSLWYSKDTFNMLAFLFKEKKELTDETLKNLLHISLLSIIKNLCSQDRGWGCIADNMLPKKEQIQNKNVFKNLLQKVNILINDIQLRLPYLSNSYNLLYHELSKKTVTFNGDVRECEALLPLTIDCIVTSPPYPNMTDYITSQRLNYYYLNSDPDIEKFKETGARFKRMRNNSNETYKQDMLSINLRLYELLKADGYLCLILPEFETHNERDNIRKIIIESIIENLSEIGFIKRNIYERILPAMRRSNNQKWASLKKEHIYLYQKPKDEIQRVSY
ncbi:MAG: site-specific DNA-methyltransferase [Bacteroidota bacterium]|nr:site-specific DNA-methyltransferase [Bacteroidota bacterium]